MSTTGLRGVRVTAIAVIVCAWVASVAGQDGDASGLGTAQNQTTIIVTSIIGFLSLLATQIFAMYRAKQQRDWDLQDRANARELAREEARKYAELLRREQMEAATLLAKVNAKNTQRVVEEVSRNTEITEAVGVKADAAYVAANNFNERMEEMRQTIFKKGTQIDNIEETTGETKEIVTDLKENQEGKP